jgi:hypothetical protein
MYRKARASAHDARKTITREAHGVVLELHTSGVPQEHLDWHYDLRRGRLCVYGGLLRFIDECIRSGHPELARKAVSWLSWYIDENTSPTTTGQIKVSA